SSTSTGPPSRFGHLPRSSTSTGAGFAAGLPFRVEHEYEYEYENACGGRGDAKRRPSAVMGGTAGAVGNSLLARARSVVRELDLDPVRDQPRLVAAVQEELDGTAPVLPVVQRAGVDVHADEFVGLR